MNKTELFLQLKNYQKQVSFSEKEHLYYYKGRTLSSVTTLVKNHFPKFNFNNEQAERSAEKLGISSKEVLSNWKASADFGTLVHTQAEKLLWCRDLESLDILDAKLSNYCEQVYEGIIETEPNLVYTELMVWDSEFSVAGTVDFLTYNPDTNEIDIWDWKTNSSICNENMTFGKFGFGELGKIPDTNFWHYALQLSIYKYILIKHGFKIGKLRLVHLQESSYNIIELPYLSDEAYIILRSQQE